MTELTGTEATERLKELVEDIDFAMLTTQDAHGNLVSRPMNTRQMDEHGNLWFFTAEDTKKVAEAQEEHHVGLSYADAKGQRWVSVAGRASIVHDDAKMEELYSPALDIWFAQGLETPGIALLKVTPVEAELWEPAHGRLVLAASMLKALVTKDTPDEDTTNHARITCP